MQSVRAAAGTVQAVNGQGRFERQGSTYSLERSGNWRRGVRRWLGSRCELEKVFEKYQKKKLQIAIHSITISVVADVRNSV